MPNILLAEQEKDFLKRGFSRRSFGRIATLIGAGSTLPFYNEAALAQLSFAGTPPPDAVIINANENPLGPCPEAADAIHNIVRQGGRYLYGETFNLRKVLAETEGVKDDHITVYAGSSQPLHTAVLAFCSPSKSFVTADPGYEAGQRAAQFIKAKVIGIPLTKDHAHDVRAMVAADPNAGIIYICNPNNPSGTLTSRADIEWALANKPAGSILLLDEAYIHLSKAWENRGSDLVAAGKEVMILRTFSKLYGMAGLRAGYAMARPDYLEKISSLGAGAMAVTAMAGATASVKVKTLVPERRKKIGDVREDTFAFLDKHNMHYIASDSNCFMLDVKRPAKEYVQAMMKEKVWVGRSWPSMPTYSRITVGTADEMEKFKAATLKVMA
jgi:histidinol-phosphate aminotransferase